MSLDIGMYHGRLPEPGRKPGGVEVFVDRLAGALTDRGHAVTVNTFAERVTDRRYEVRRLRPARAVDGAFSREYLAPWLMNFNLSRGHDVFHFHGDDWFCLRRPWPVVRTFYGSALLESLTAQSWKRRVDQALLFGLEQVSARKADARFGIGSDSRLLYRADGVLQLGVTLPQEERRPARAPTILFTGTWDGRKRGRELHRLFCEEIRPRVPGAELWMVSDRCDPAPGVTWFQTPTDAQLQALLRAAWAFCLPSSYEGFGIPYLEAMAWGVPVVATPNPGADDVLRAGTAGVVVELDDVGDALSQLLEDARHREHVGEAGRRRAEDFAWDIIGETYEAAYALAVERWRS